MCHSKAFKLQHGKLRVSSSKAHKSQRAKINKRFRGPPHQLGDSLPCLEKQRLLSFSLLVPCWNADPLWPDFQFPNRNQKSLFLCKITLTSSSQTNENHSMFLSREVTASNFHFRKITSVSMRRTDSKDLLLAMYQEQPVLAYRN